MNENTKNFRNDFYKLKELGKKAAEKNYDNTAKEKLWKADIALSRAYPRAWCWHNGSTVDNWIDEIENYTRPPEVETALQ